MFKLITAIEQRDQLRQMRRALERAYWAGDIAESAYDALFDRFTAAIRPLRDFIRAHGGGHASADLHLQTILSEVERNGITQWRVVSVTEYRVTIEPCAIGGLHAPCMVKRLASCHGVLRIVVERGDGYAKSL